MFGVLFKHSLVVLGAFAMLSLAGCNKPTPETATPQSATPQTTAPQPKPAVESEDLRVRLQTSEGDIVLQLNSKLAPNTVKNFLGYVKAGFYEGTIFHRVMDNFMIQGGGYDDRFNKKPTRLAILNEAYNGLKNKRGSIAMARTTDPHSATAQFFINLKDNDFLDHRDPTPSGWGYAVFGEVIEGMGVVSKIGKVDTGPAGPFPSDYPRKPIFIQKVTIEKTSNTGSK